MVFLIIYVVFRGIDSNNKVIRKSFVFIKILAPAIATFLFCRTTDLSYADSAIIGGVVLVLFAFLTIKELINIKDYIDHGYDEDKFYLTTLIEGRSILSYSFYFLILLAFLFCMFIDTYLSSKKERNFDVFYKGDYYAVISYSSDSLVAKKIINKQLSGDFFIFKLEALENIGINKKNITSLSGGPPSARQLRRLVEPHSANRQSR